MHAWQRFLASGKVLNAESQRHFHNKGIVAGSSDRGFLFYSSQGYESGFLLSSNAHEKDNDLASRLARSLAELVSAE